MYDVLLIGLVVAFFVVAELYVRGCDRILARGLRDRTKDRP